MYTVLLYGRNGLIGVMRWCKLSCS